MRAEERDAAYLWDMLQAARDATATVAGIDEQQLQRDRMRMLALERSMELIGEAARRVSSSFREKHPEIPRRPIWWRRQNAASWRLGTSPATLLFPAT